MIGKLWKFILFFLLCLAIALLFNLPIQNVLTYVKPPDSVRLAGIDGTIVGGKAREIVIDQFPLRDIEYRYMPSCIPLLKICYRIDYSQGKLQVAYDLLNGDTEVVDVRIQYPVAELTRHMPGLIVQPVGHLELEMDELRFFEGRPLALSGKLIWRDFGLDDEGVDFIVGDYQADFTGSPQQYDFKLKDLSGELDVKGKGKIRPGGDYDLEVRIIATDNTSAQVRHVLGLVAKRINHSNFIVQQNGRLPPSISRQLFK
jgi:hypothetical protein